MTIYLPDDLAELVKTQLGDTNISAICQTALREELDRVEARAKVTEEGFERIELYDSRKERDVAFQGRKIGRSLERESTAAWLTPKHAIAAYDGDEQALYVYDDYEAFSAERWPEDLIAEVAGSLGEKYTEELDI
jgi:post-segregation antitoxin (ccd killing protein)